MPNAVLMITPVPSPEEIKKNSETFTYQRRVSIKNLYSAKNTLQSFAILTFDSINGFFAFVQKRFNEKNPAKEYIIKYASGDELQLILDLVSKTSIVKDVMITVRPTTDDALLATTLLLTEGYRGIALSLTPAEVLKLTDLMRKDLTLPIHKSLLPGAGNWGWIRTVWKADSYFNEYEDLLEATIANPYFRAIDFQIDYASFEESPIKELHRLFFYYQNLRVWEDPSTFSVSSNPFGIEIPKKEPVEKACGDSCQCEDKAKSTDKPFNYNQGLTFKVRGSPLRAFVRDNLDFSLDDLGTFDFPLSKYLDDDGVTLPLDLINTLREILDIHFEHIPKTKGINLYLIDIAQNMRIMKDPYMVSFLTRVILDWTYPQEAAQNKEQK